MRSEPVHARVHREPRVPRDPHLNGHEDQKQAPAQSVTGPRDARTIEVRHLLEKMHPIGCQYLCDAVDLIACWDRPPFGARMRDLIRIQTHQTASRQLIFLPCSCERLK